MKANSTFIFIAIQTNTEGAGTVGNMNYISWSLGTIPGKLCKENIDNYNQGLCKCVQIFICHIDIGIILIEISNLKLNSLKVRSDVDAELLKM